MKCEHQNTRSDRKGLVKNILSTEAGSRSFRERIEDCFAFFLLVSEESLWNKALSFRKVVLIEMNAKILCSNGGLVCG